MTDCDWWGEGESLALVFHKLEIRPIFVIGEAASTRKLLMELPDESGYLNLKPAQLEAMEGIYRFTERHEMRRMILENESLRAGETEPLSSIHSAEVARLYASGDGAGIAFAPFQLDTGFFRGIRRSGELAAVAGVHVMSRAESVAGIGNIFTRPDCRGHGLAQTVVSAVVAALREAGIRTVGLNVEHTNTPAIRVYEAIGFRTCFHYYEGIAERAGAFLRHDARAER